MSLRILFAILFGAIVMIGAFYIRPQPAEQNLQPQATPKAQIPKVTIPKEQSTTQATSTFAQTNESKSDDAQAPHASTTGTEQAQNLTETDILTRNVIGPYIDQNNTDTYSKASGAKIVQNATKYLFTLEYTPKTPKDMHETADISKESVLVYKQSLYEALRPLFALNDYELTLYAQAVKDNDSDTFDSLKRIADIYKQAGDDVLALSAPQDVSAVHLAIINSLYKFTTVLTQMAKGFDDPAGSLSGTGNFSSVEEEFGQAFTKLGTYFIIKEVTTPIL